MAFFLRFHAENEFNFKSMSSNSKSSQFGESLVTLSTFFLVSLSYKNFKMIVCSKLGQDGPSVAVLDEILNSVNIAQQAYHKSFVRNHVEGEYI